MKPTVLIVASAMALAACTTNPYTGEQQLSRTAIGAGLGAAGGALTGALIGKGTSAKTRKSALIGAGVGALVGGGVGLYMDQQESALRQRLQATGVSVTRVGDDIVLNMPSNITFDFARADIKPDFYDVLNSVSLVLNEYNQSIVDVYGHTDNVGSDQANFDLSIQRAESVANYLAGQQVNPQRLSLQGFGETRPIASNATEQGRAQNRRVEIRIQPLTQG
jgi:outer membrane protein OmpA-like peptidoglycan-associated protein